MAWLLKGLWVIWEYTLQGTVEVQSLFWYFLAMNSTILGYHILTMPGCLPVAYNFPNNKPTSPMEVTSAIVTVTKS